MHIIPIFVNFGGYILTLISNLPLTNAIPLDAQEQGSKISGITRSTEDVPAQAPQSLGMLDGRSLPASDYDQQLARTMRFDFKPICTELNWDQGITAWRYSLKKVDCDRSMGNQRRIKITCASKYIEHSQGHYFLTHLGNDFPVFRYCPIGTICQSVEAPASSDMSLHEDVGCVDENDVSIDIVNTNPKSAKPAPQDEHCGLDLNLPGSHYAAPIGQTPLNLMLTEQVSYLNGTPYHAPVLYIRDKSSPYGLDRVLRHEASVASTEIQLGVYRGRYQTREYEFCMQFKPTHAATSLVFMYSFFQLPHRTSNAQELSEQK